MNKLTLRFIDSINDTSFRTQYDSYEQAKRMIDIQCDQLKLDGWKPMQKVKCTPEQGHIGFEHNKQVFLIQWRQGL